MATVQSVIDDARLDLLDYGDGIETTDEILLEYLNRLMRLMNSYLANSKSDLLYTREESIDCVSSQNYVDISSLDFEDIWEVWLGQVRLVPISISKLYYERRWSNGNAQPYYWCLSGNNILFEATCDGSYTNLIIDYWSKLGADKALTDSMPYNDIFNDLFTQSLCVYGRAKNQDVMEQPDMMFYKEFNEAAQSETLRRSWKPKSYYINF